MAAQSLCCTVFVEHATLIICIKPLNNAGNKSASSFYGFLGIKSRVAYSLIKVSVVILCNIIKISIILSSNSDMLLLICGRA